MVKSHQFLSGNIGQESSRQYLLDIFNSVILKDVVKRNNIRDVDLLERIISYVISNDGTNARDIGLIL